MGFDLSTRYRFGASLIWCNMLVTASLCILSIRNRLVVESKAVSMLVYDERPNMNGEQKFTQSINLLSSARDVGMACALNTCFRFPAWLWFYHY